ncbi:hypothetical protein [Halomicrobium salinisoli]|uniref:hypothetical protein n=1 Tax=Halomicrobium salinisoli TaxID=2878391 RepID=UPI001CEFF879|nr:hypothetical protein [Halomicrobium salinisoli]
MNAVTDRFDDTLEPLGIATGAFLVLVGLGTLLGAPWATNPNLGPVVVTVLGSLLSVVIGVGLAYLSWTGE